MKDQFIEKDGMLFMNCKPEPLEKDSPMPCLVRLIQDDSPMGLYNKKTVPSGRLNGIHIVYIHRDDIDFLYYSRYEIIAKHCLEGTREWALGQMLNGKAVFHDKTKKYKSFKDKIYYVDEDGTQDVACSYYNWIRCKPKDGWKICEETEPKPEVGKWYQHKKRKHYVCVVAVNGEECKVRFAGESEYAWDGWMKAIDFEANYEPAPLEPNFSNAKVGDECYSSAVGACRIIRIDRNDKPEITVNCGDNKGYYRINGKFVMIDIHPTLFHSAAQCAAYFAEVALKEMNK